LTLPGHFELTDTWRDIRADLRQAVGESTYDIWLASLEAKDWNGTVLLLEAPSDTKAWLAKRFGWIVEECATRILGRPVQLAFTGAGAESSSARGNESASTDFSSEPGSIDAFNPRYSFDQFIIGDGNRMAHAAALAVAELPGQAYNPLFLYAPPGLGKTHLLHAIGNYVLAFGGGASVRYSTVESFTNQFVNALGTGSIHRFKRAYRDADVLLIDDVQFLASKAKTEEEFFHTFNALYETGRQLVITCDRLPRELVAVEERLRERFESGLVADIRPPDLATRVAILRKRAALDRITLAEPGVLEMIAERVTTNVRALEGALIRVVALHSLTRRPIDIALTATVLDKIYPDSRSRSVSIASIQAAVASHFDITVQDLVSPRRAPRIAWPRQLAMHLARDLTHASLPAIGKAFGGRNHATVHYACRRVSDRLVNDSEASRTIHELTDAIRKDEGDRSS
jgi:chromosomal replication initiator protein